MPLVNIIQLNPISILIIDPDAQKRNIYFAAC